MFIIQESFADCKSCSLYNEPGAILETNCPEDISNIDVIFIAENPGKVEVEKERPLVGRAGQLFRSFMKKHKLDSFRYILTNVVLCQTLLPNGRTGNPDDSTIERCKINCFNLIEYANPKLIVLLGGSPNKAFGLMENAKISQIAGRIFEWKKWKVFSTFHPSYIMRNVNELSEIYDEHFRSILAFLSGQSIKTHKISKKINTKIKTDDTNIPRYVIPPKFYSEDYRLVDVQYLWKENQVIYIFRDKENNKVIHKESDDYICFQLKTGENRPIVPYSQLKPITIPYSERRNLSPETTYEGDIKIEVKHTQDYYFNNKGEPEIKNLNVMYFDIEIFSGESREFPHADEAKYPICMITYKYHDVMKTYVLDPDLLHTKSYILEEPNTFICKSEKELIGRFIKDLHELNPDFIAGWNTNSFDFPYIVKRMQNLGMDESLLSPFGEVFLNTDKKIVYIAGYICIDQLDLYKMFEFTKRENYRLGTIAQIELGETKLDSGTNFNQMFMEDFNKSIRYNVRDTELLEKLEIKLKHIQLLNELRNITKNCFSSSMSALPQLDSLIVYFLKERGLSVRNSIPGNKSEKFEGAFVKEPIKGLHQYIVDFDFTSLYPSLIRTYNIGINTFMFKTTDPQIGYYLSYDRNNLPNKIEIIVDPFYSQESHVITKEKLIDLVENKKLIHTINGCFFLPHEQEISYYSQILEDLLKSRKIYKNKMFEAMTVGDKDKESLYDIKQKVYKVLANSIYGILGNNYFRFFNIDCAKSITYSGKEVTKTSILYADKKVESFYKENVSIDGLSKDEVYNDFNRETPNVITADTDSLFVTYENLPDIKDLKFEDALPKIQKYNDIIQKYLNEEVIIELITRHNVKKEHNFLELKNEFIAKRGLFLAKKRYAIYVLFQEGRNVDKIVSMGVETKRSDYPSKTKKDLEELLKLLLKENEFSILKIFDFINKTSKEFMDGISKGLKEVARPISFTKPVDQYKVIPQGVHAMLNWNTLVYESFQPGTKGYLFKIHGLKLDKAPEHVRNQYRKEFLQKNKSLEVLALPDEEEKLPDWVIPDIKAMLQFAWKDRYNLLLDPILKLKQNDHTLTF